MNRAGLTLGTIAVLLAVTAGALQSVAPDLRAQSLPGTDFEKKAEELLISYGKFKHYAEATAGEIDRRLGDDRRGVFRSIVWATFMPLTPRKAGTIPANARLIDYIDAVHGIWGVRPGDTEGKHQFRMSLKFKLDLKKMVEAAKEFGSFGFSCHVLLPEKTGGDDQKDFTAFQFADDAGCRRGKDTQIQVSWDEDDVTIGEIDLDLDKGRCHLTPANSDVRNMKAVTANDNHLPLFNSRNSYFDKSLVLAKCDVSRFHCRDSYDDDLCK